MGRGEGRVVAGGSSLPSTSASANNDGQPVGSPAHDPAPPSSPAKDQVSCSSIHLETQIK